jgi:hypothetical protein
MRIQRPLPLPRAPQQSTPHQQQKLHRNSRFGGITTAINEQIYEEPDSPTMVGEQLESNPREKAFNFPESQRRCGHQQQEEFAVAEPPNEIPSMLMRKNH